MNNSELRQRRHLKYALERRVEVYQRRNEEFPAKAGNIFTGVLEVPGKKYTIYVTLDGSNQVVEAVNGRVIANVGTPIIVGYDANDQTKTMRVLRQRYAYIGETPGDGIPYHHAQHEWFGGDDVFISSGQILPGMAVPVVGTLNIKIYPRQYRTAAGWYYPPAYMTVDMTSHVATTTGKARWSLIVVNSAGSFAVRDGSEITGFGSLTDADKPEPTNGDTPLWFVKSFTGITQFIHNPDNDYFEDARGISIPSGAGTGDVVAPSGSITDGDLALFDGDKYHLKSGGAPGASTNPLLAHNAYAGGDYTSLTSASLADVDATNMAVTFTAPASGNVMVDLIATAYSGNGAAGQYLVWGLRESTTDIMTGDIVVRCLTTSYNSVFGVCKTFVLTGISAGSHTYKWSYLQSAGTGAISANANSPAVMRVWALP